MLTVFRKPAGLNLRRYFGATAPVLKKKAAAETISGTASKSSNENGFDSRQMKASLESLLQKFTEKVKAAKSASLSSDKFAKMQIDLGHGAKGTLESLATVAARGNKISIVAFDPKQVKRIQTAVITELGVPAEPSKTDGQTLSVVIPQETNAKKAATAQKIKEAYELIRNSSGGRDASISSIRSKYLAPLKKAASKSSGVSKDDVKRQTQEIEQLVKTYSTKLQELFQKSSS